jgi:glycosyltransferase involved in cell wall biosynthesis
LHKNVREIIVVDDASTDETPMVLAKLVAMYPGRVRFLRNEKNSKQVFCKNRAKVLAKTPWVYFGDDDSVLSEGSMTDLLTVAQRNQADIVGAIALYCRIGENPADALVRYKKQPALEDERFFVDFTRLRFNFSRRPARDLALPVTQASFIIRRDWCVRHDFDQRYTHNCYREETDYLLCCHRAGARIYLSREAYQINLPPNQATGGARSGMRIAYEWYSLLNTWRFIHKHNEYFRQEVATLFVYTPLFFFAVDRLRAALRKLGV